MFIYVICIYVICDFVSFGHSLNKQTNKQRRLTALWTLNA